MQRRAKIALALTLVAAIVIVCGYSSGWSNTARRSDAAADMLRSKLQGTWEAVGSRPGTRQVKLITGDHFTWVFYNRATGLPLTMAGGTCSCTGNSYIEHVEYGTGGVQHTLVGHDQVFTINFDGNRLVETGTLSNGMKLTELWRHIE